MNTLRDIIDSIPDTDDPALITPGKEVLSYKNLGRRIEYLSNELLRLGLSENDRVGIYIPDKANTVIAIGACIKAGLVFVPLDMGNSQVRNNEICINCRLRALILSPECHFPFENKSEILNKHALDGFTCILISQSGAMHSPQIPPDLAFILNTSGSTGIPKAVMITQQNVCSFIVWVIDQYDFYSTDRFASIAPFHFDLSVFDLYISLYFKATLVLFEPEVIRNPTLLASFIAEYHISIIYATPTLYTSLVDYGKMTRNRYDAVRYIFFAGEPFRVAKLKALYQIIPHAKYSNWYGPTETNVVTYFDLPQNILDIEDTLPIGRPCRQLHAMIEYGTDNSNIGILYISGPNVSPGYFNQPLSTKEVFQLKNQVIWYCTGDLVSINPSGDYTFHGRRDRMVKRRGYRIELDEIQQILSTLNCFEDVAIVYDRQKEIPVIYCVYTSLLPIDRLSIAHVVQSKLPKYMIPDHFIRIEALPLTSTGKIDYQAILSLI